MSLEGRLQSGVPIVLDGATGTQLEAQGVDVANPLWGSVALLTAAGRRQTEAVHRAYVAAGAEMVIANSHNLSRGHVERYLAIDASPSALTEARQRWSGPDVEALTRWLNAQAVACARTAGGYVAGCLASPDQPYTTQASLTADEVADRLRLQYEALQAAEPDLIIFEMLTTHEDVEGVCRLLDRGPRPVPVAFGLVAAVDATIGGVRWSTVVDRIRPLAPFAVFIQCTPFARVLSALQALAAVAPDLVLGAYANDGGYDQERQAWSRQGTPPEVFAAGARAWVGAGARIVGGCCGTGPAHIAAMADTVGGPPSLRRTVSAGDGHSSSGRAPDPREI